VLAEVDSRQNKKVLVKAWTERPLAQAYIPYENMNVEAPYKTSNLVSRRHTSSDSLRLEIFSTGASPFHCVNAPSGRSMVLKIAATSYLYDKIE
jgi:hypothetical protein